MSRIFNNYHKHSVYTNPKIADSVVTNEDYAKRASQLGHGIISIMEHGWQGRYIEGYELSKKYGLKFVFGTEAYWVKDRHEKDRTNCHIYIGAKNENGRRNINRILSIANTDGFYGTSRIDKELIFSLPKDDVIITTACVAFWKYADVDEFVLEMSKYFTNFFLEVQYHNTESQKKLNSKILKMSKDFSIPIIMGCDSHYIMSNMSDERDNYLLSRNIEYEDEDGWYLDYPDGDEAYNRFITQGVLTPEEIDLAMDNTLIFSSVEDYNCPCFNKEIKMPRIPKYSNCTQEEINDIFVKLIWEQWNKELPKIPSEKISLYEEEIQKEIDIVIDTKHADYFINDYYLVEEAKKNGGVITPSGRGSGVSFYINKLLGFTKIDRISADVKMYPERFMSKTRILEAKTLADLDMNLANPEVFAEAQKTVFGYDHSFPMLAYGTLKPKAAWKMYARAKNISFETANEVSSQIEKYEHALKIAPEDEKDDIIVTDFIDKKYKELYTESENYQGIIDSYSIHPCAYLIYQGNIPEEIGLIKIKDALCCVMDGKWAEDYKFLKNDLLKVNVVKLIDRIFKKINVEMFDVNTLLEKCKNNENVWDIYKKSLTMGINQVEQKSTKGRVSRYSPRNISELCAFVAAIRPGFKSMYPIFEERKDFSYGIKSLDELIQTPQMDKSFILYQEIQMAVLNYAGIPMVECYEIIKNISKKRVEKVLVYKNTFLSGFKKKMIDLEHQSDENAEKLSHKIWQILEDSSRYSFNASHSYSVAVDSLYGAYLKATYPLEFYSEFLNLLEEDGAKERLTEAKIEAKNGFGIRLLQAKFRQDNRKMSPDYDLNGITFSLKSIKGFGQSVGEELFLMKDMKFKYFHELISFIRKTTSINKTQFEILIKLDYFSEFGTQKFLLRILKIFDIIGDKKTILKEKAKDSELFYSILIRNGRETAKKIMDIDSVSVMGEIEDYLKQTITDDVSLYQKLLWQEEFLGYISISTDKKEDVPKAIVLNVRELNSKKTKKLWMYCLTILSVGNGKQAEILAAPSVYEETPVSKYDVIYLNSKYLKKEIYKGKINWKITFYTKINL